MTTGIIGTDPNGILLSTTACLAHGHYIVTTSLPLAMAWAGAVSDRITSWEFAQIWASVTGGEVIKILPFVHACLGISS